MNNIEHKIIKPKLGVLELAKQLGSVSQACKTMDSETVFTALKSFMRMAAKKRYVRLVNANQSSRTVCLNMLRQQSLI